MLRELSLHSLIFGLGTLAQSAIQFLLLPILTSRLPPSEFGAYSLIQMASVVASAVFYFGITSALPRSYFDYEDQRDRREVFTTSFLLVFGGATVQIAVGNFGGAAISKVLLDTERYARPIAWAFIAGAIGFVNQFLFTFLRLHRRSVAVVALSILTLAGSLALSIIFLRMHPGDVAAPFQAITIAHIVVALVFLSAFAGRAFALRIKRREIAILLSFGLPTLLTSIAVMAIDWADRIFIEKMVSTEAVAVYSVGYRLGSVVNALVIAPFAQIWSTVMIEYRDHANVGGFFTKVASYYSLLTSIVVVAACFFVRDLLPAIARSSAYLAAAPVILLIMVGYAIYGMTNIVSAGLFYSRRIGSLAAVYYLVALANIALNFYFVPRYGIYGAAITSLVTYSAIPVLIYRQARKDFSIVFEVSRIVRIMAVVIACLAFAVFFDERMHLAPAFRAVAFVMVIILLLLVGTDESERATLRAAGHRIVRRLLPAS